MPPFQGSLRPVAEEDAQKAQTAKDRNPHQLIQHLETPFRRVHDKNSKERCINSLRYL